MRAYVLPSFLVSATNGLLFTFSPTTRSIIFAGVAVGSAYNFDVVVSNLILSGGGYRVGEAVASAVGESKISLVRHRPLSGACLQYSFASPPPRKERLLALAFDISGYGYTRAHQAQYWTAFLLCFSTILLQLTPPDTFFPAIEWLATWNGYGLPLSELDVAPCFTISMTTSFLPMLVLLIAIPLENLTDTFIDVGFAWRGTARRLAPSKVAAVVETALCSLIKMAGLVGIHYLHDRILINLTIHPFDGGSSLAAL